MMLPMSKLSRRTLLGSSLVAPLVLRAETAAASAIVDLDRFDPFAPASSHYAHVAKYIWKLESARQLVNDLWTSYVNTGQKKHADWCFVYWYNYWRLVTLGDSRVKAARIGVKMADKVLSDHGPTAWNLFWQACFLGLESISRGVLDAAHLLPKFKELMEKSVALDPAMYYANGYVGLAKLYLKTPTFPVSIGDPEKGWLYIKLAEPHQRGKFALWYLFAAEGFIATKNDANSAYEILDQLSEIKPPDVASQIILETTKIDGKSLRAEVEAGRYNKYKWDPMFTPLDTTQIRGG